MQINRVLAGVSALAMVCGAVTVNAAQTGDNLTIGTYDESALETQKLINNRPDVQRQMENIGRGLVAVQSGSHIFISWRWLGTESLDVKYNLYRNDVKLNDEPMNITNYTDVDPIDNAKYSVSTVINGVEGEKCDPVSVWKNGYLEIPLDKPTDEYIVKDIDRNNPYTPGDVSVADLDGDGEYEYIVKWDPRYAPDASKVDFAGECRIDAYKQDGTRMWRINMGKNVRSGPHDTQFIVYDFDNDGKAEMAVRTADGTVAGDGTVIGDANADWYTETGGKNLKGPLYLTVFKGEDGSVMDTVPFYPQTTGTWEDGTAYDQSAWGDDYGNRSERYLGALGCFDGEHTGFIQARGYYNRTFMAAYHVENGKIVTEWQFDSEKYPNAEGNHPYAGQGNHSMSTADVDYDGKDEVIYGSMALDNDGTPLYSTGLGHGDSQHVGDLIPSRPGLEVYSCHEWTGADYGYEMRDARTGEILFGEKTGNDNGRACTGDVDPRYEGEESWSAENVLTAADGTVISTDYSMPANFAIYWDGDLGREVLDGIEISKWNPETETADTIFRPESVKSINAAKANPALEADIFGDWREEVIYPTTDGNALRIYTTDIPTDYRIPTLMHDTQYRNHVALQNVCYNQTTHLSYYLGYDTKTIPVPQMFTVDNGNVVKNSDLAKGRTWNIKDLYNGTKQELVLNSNVAMVDDVPMYVDDENRNVAPYLDSEDRTMVPIRFIAEVFRIDVDYDDTTKNVTMGNISMTVGNKAFTNGTEKSEMDTVPVVQDGRTYVPVRFVAEALGMKVDYFDGIIVISDKEITTPKAGRADEITSAKPSEKKDYSGIYGKLKPLEFTASIDKDKTAAANDDDVTTSYKAGKNTTLTIKLDGAPGLPAAMLCFGDEEEHTVKFEVSKDGENWETIIEKRVVKGKGDDYCKVVFGVPPYRQYVRYTCLDENGCNIAEFAVLGVQ